MFRATMCPSSGKTTVFMRHLVLVILKQVNSLKLQGPVNNALHFMTYALVILNYLLFCRITSSKCRTNTIVSPDDGHIVARNMYRKEINMLRKLVHQVGFIHKIRQCCVGKGI
jgi:hypothetical protein